MTVATAERTVAQEFAEFLVQMDCRNLPADVTSKIKVAILDQLGCQLIGSTMSWNTTIYGVVKSFGGREEATVVNYGHKTLAHDAAFINATFGQGCELDDGVRRGGPPGGHPGSMTVPVALALGEREHASGQAMLSAVVAGYETAFRLGQAMPGTRANGFHNQGIFGPFAATTVAARMLGLDADQLAQAFAIAGSQCSSTTEYAVSGGEVKRMHAGLATRAGIQSAMLAKAGLTGPLTIFEGKRGGILKCFGGQDDPSALLADLGEDLAVNHISYKTVPTVGNLQSPVLVFADMVQKHNLQASEVEKIDVGLGERGLAHGASILEPKDTVSAQFSLAWSLGIRLVKGSNDLQLYIDPNAWHDPEVLEVAKKVHGYPDPHFVGAKQKGCHITITLKDGRTFEQEEEFLKGAPQNPLTTKELTEKFRRLASSSISESNAEKVIDAVDHLEQLDDVTELVTLLRA